jgi:hypothetical protein
MIERLTNDSGAGLVVAGAFVVVVDEVRRVEGRPPRRILTGGSSRAKRRPWKAKAWLDES